jgi:hypothetical protein
MRAAGYEPLEPYPGRRKPWRSRRLATGEECAPCYVNVRPITTPRTPDDATAVMRAAGYEPLDPYPGSHKPWRSWRLSTGEDCSPRYCDVKPVTSPVATDVVMATMRAAGYEPLEPYPNNRSPWRCKCMTCDQERTPRYVNVLNGNRCRICNPSGGKGGARPDLQIPDDIAIEVMRAGGYEPLEPYPGNNKRWRCRCLTCGQERTPSYANVKRGARCGNCHHRGPAKGTPKPPTDSGPDT